MRSWLSKVVTRKVDARATGLVSARRTASGLEAYPGRFPATLDEAYRVQDTAIGAWSDTIAGWKVGGIGEPWASKLDVDRLAGPIYAQNVKHYDGSSIAMPVFADGFAAVEAEVTAVLAKDASLTKKSYTLDEALDLIDALYVGVEIASSPYSEINDHGPLVTITDFGNNFGIILGEEIENWRELALDGWEFETVINDASVGKATPNRANGGPVESVRFLLENVAKRGMPAKAGMMILTGAVTGVHQAYAGDKAAVRFRDQTAVTCSLVSARPAAA